jgi:hypothetical protein
MTSANVSGFDFLCPSIPTHARYANVTDASTFANAIVEQAMNLARTGGR